MHDLDTTVNRFRDAWNRHDADELASLWVEDGELNHPWGTRAVGREAIRRVLAHEHDGTMAASVLRIEQSTAISTEPNLVAEIDGVLDDVAAPNGKRYSLRHTLSAMFVPHGAEWLIKTMTALPR